MKPFLLLIDGPSGVGKSAAAEIIHQKFPRTALVGLDRIKWSISGFRRDLRNNAVVTEASLAVTQVFLEHRINVIFDQRLMDGEFARLRRIARRANARFVAVQLTAPRSVILQRIQVRSRTKDYLKRPPVAMSRWMRNLRQYEARAPIPAIAIETAGYSPRQVARKILTLMRRGA